jgi:hypothetical protein
MRRDSDTPPWQAVLNARDMPLEAHVGRETNIAVAAFVNFERDGWTLLEGLCDRWYGKLVHVRIADKRIARQSVWLHATDVRRLRRSCDPLNVGAARGR